MERGTAVDATHIAAIEEAIRRACLRWSVYGADAEDLSNHLWCVVLENDVRVIRLFRGRSALSTYLFPIMMRSARKWLERRAKRRRHEVLMGDTYCGLAHLVRSESTGESAANSDLYPDIQQAVSRLRRVDRLIVRARFNEGRRVGRCRLARDFTEGSRTTTCSRD